MKKLLLLSVSIMLVLCAQAQNYLINFAVSGPFNSLDSIRIENLTQSTSIVINGDEILNLVGVVNIQKPIEIDDFVKISPNPMNGEAEVAFFAKQSGNTNLSIYDIQGRELFKLSDYCVKGIQKYFLSGLNHGVYLFNIKGDSYFYTLKIISQGAEQYSVNLIKSSTIKQVNEGIKPIPLIEKGINNTIIMSYTTGDVIKYTGYRYNCTSEITNIPVSSNTVTFPFSNCLAPTVTLDSISLISKVSARGNSNISFDGGAPVTSKGVCWSTSESPTIANEFTADGNGIGNFASNITALAPNTTYYVRAYATNDVGTAYSNQISFTTLADIPTLTVANITDISASSATGGGNITSDGGNPVTAKGVCWSTSQSPTIANEFTADGIGIGSFSSSITALAPNTTYYVRAYATNGVGTAYSNQISFTTLALIPTVTFINTTDILKTTAQAVGMVTSNGGDSVTSRGVCWSINSLPTILDNKTIDGSDTGQFVSNLTGLEPSTRYFIRAYATNGVGTGYSSQDTFQTINTPILTTNTISNITAYTAQSGGNITSDEGSPIISRGVCWSINQSPTLSDSSTFEGTGTGAFQSNITGLTTNTTYYVRSYATNIAGTSYGNQLSFTTANNQLPVIITTPVSNISIHAALSGGIIISDGGYDITEHGICWNSVSNPTILNRKKVDLGTDSVYSVALDSLSEGTTYYIRAYATNSEGTSYGNEISFTTTDYPNCGIVRDIDSNTYRTVTIGNQCWFRDNLRTQRYRNGYYIASYRWQYTNWGNITQPAYVYLGPEYGEEIIKNYGYFYNFYAATQSDICPFGWRVPHDSDWVLLKNYLGGDVTAGGKLKDTDLQFWQSPNGNATNESGFTAKGAGFMINTGAWSSDKYVAAFWTNASSSTYDEGYCYKLSNNNGYLFRDDVTKKNGQSIRCIKEVCNIPLISFAGADQLNLTNPQTTITGNTNPEATGKWKLLSGLYGSITDTLNPATTFFGALGQEYKLVWTLTNKCMDVSSDTLIISFQSPIITNCGTITDIAGNVYNTVNIGDQCWMKENLKITYFRDGTPIIPFTTTAMYTQGIISPNYMYANRDSISYYNDFGLIYNGYTIKGNNICPAGWHIPTSSEFTTLINQVGGMTMGGNLKEYNSNSWSNPLPQHDQFGFSGRGAGQYDLFENSYSGIKAHGSWFFNNNDSIGYMRLQSANSTNNVFSNIILTKNISVSNHFCIRCLKNQTEAQLPNIIIDSISNITKLSSRIHCRIISQGGSPVIEQGVILSTNPNPNIKNTKYKCTNLAAVFTVDLSVLRANTTYYIKPYAVNKDGLVFGNEISFTTLAIPNCGTVTDVDGNVYNSAIIGSQCWMSENLKTTNYKNGSPIDYPGTNLTTWNNNTTGAYSWYNNDQTSDKAKYGALYNGYAVNTGNLCPEGWHVPSDAEWTTMEDYLGGRYTIGCEIKDTISVYWPNYNNLSSSNNSGFTARAGGCHNNSYSDNGYSYYGGIWWSMTSVSTNAGITRSLNSTTNTIGRAASSNNIGSSVRCIKNSYSGNPLPTVSTNQSSITSNSIDCIGSITTNGVQINARGFCWSLHIDPTINDFKSFDSTYQDIYSKTITDLVPSKTYYLRAFAVYPEGVAYGNVITFTTPLSTCGIVKDVEGNTYNTVVINSKCWLKENLKTKKYKNGTAIRTGYVWPTDTLGQYKSYNTNYGLLYNWPVIKSKKICPRGWIVPTKDEWMSLINSAGGVPNAGGNLKSMYNFSDPNYGATDKFGFSGTGGGQTNVSGTNENIGVTGTWWSSTNNGPNSVWKMGVGNNYIFVDTGYVSGNYGFSVRCIKDTCQPPTNSNAGSDQLNLLDTCTYLEGNTHSINENGFWTIASGAGGIIADSSNRNSLFCGYLRTEYRLVWNIVNPCDDISTDTVKISFGQINIDLTTNSIQTITPISAICNSSINSINDTNITVLTRGVCWGTNPNPTINDLFLTNGNGLGAYAIQLHSLMPNTTYYVRSFATCSFGIVYGTEIIFSTNDYPNCSTISDIDGNTYNTVMIGGQCWMKENLKTTKYNDGTPIYKIEDDIEWAYKTTPAFGWKNNDSINNFNIGALYNWYTVVPDNICPVGWRVPSHNDWKILSLYLQSNGFNYDGSIDTDNDITTNNKTAKSLASKGPWEISTIDGTPGKNDYLTYQNKSGFSGIPESSAWWSTTINYTNYCWFWALNHELVGFNGYDDLKYSKKAIRCVKN